MQAVVDTLKRPGVADQDVQTTDLSMNPEYTPASAGSRQFRATGSTRRSAVVVQDLTKASGIVTAAVDAGGAGVRLDGLRLQVGDPEGALTPARTDAFEQARAKAEEYAADAGLELGEVVRISEVDGAAGDYDCGPPAAYADSAEIPIQAGQQDLTASVAVVFELK